MSNVTKYTIDLVDVLDDETKLLDFLRMERWIADRPDHPGEVVRQWFKDLYQDNKLIKNELVLGGRRVDLRAITMPVLNIYATGDTIIPVSCSQGMGDISARRTTPRWRCPAATSARSSAARRKNIWHQRWPMVQKPQRLKWPAGALDRRPCAPLGRQHPTRADAYCSADPDGPCPPL